MSCGYTVVNAYFTSMKRLMIIFVSALFLGALTTSCTGGNKACAAYAKHDSAKQQYSDVQ